MNFSETGLSLPALLKKHYLQKIENKSFGHSKVFKKNSNKETKKQNTNLTRQSLQNKTAYIIQFMITKCHNFYSLAFS